jgi:hypothetical protein
MRGRHEPNCPAKSALTPSDVKVEESYVWMIAFRNDRELVLNGVGENRRLGAQTGAFGPASEQRLAVAPLRYVKKDFDRAWQV